MRYICHKVANINKISQLTSFELYRRHSLQLELTEKADIFASETFDSALFGENIISTLSDAYKRLLVDDPVIIPSKVHNLKKSEGGDNCIKF